MPLPLMAAAIAAPIIGGIAGNLMSQGDRNAAMDAVKKNYDRLAGINIPDSEKLRLALEEYQSAGQLNAQTETAEQLDQGSALEDINLDPRLRQTRMNQLESLQKLGESSFTPEEQSQLNKMRRQTEGDNQSRIKALLENQQARGVASGESALAAQMLESQAATNRQAQQSEAMSAQAFRRALEAKAGAAGLAGQLEDTDYSRGSELGQTLDSRELQNVNLRAGSQQRNVDRFNQAQQMNLQQRQNMMNQNTGLRNEQQAFNKNLEQRRFDNEMNKANAMSGASSNLSNAHTGAANATAGMWAGIGGGIGQMAGAGAMGKMGAAAPAVDAATEESSANGARRVAGGWVK